MILIKQLLDLNRGLTLFSEIFSLNILIPVGKEEDMWDRTPCSVAETLCSKQLCKSCEPV